MAILAYGEDIIHYDIVRQEGNDGQSTTASGKRKVVIKVHPNQRVVALAPVDASNEAIQAAVAKQARWIWQNICDFAEQQQYVMARLYISGETQFYLGKRYVLKVSVEPGLPDKAKLSRGKLLVCLRNDSGEKMAKVKHLVAQWYASKAHIIFAQRLQAMLPRATWVKNKPDFRVLTMKKQWGSCSSQGQLILNPHLVKAPKECIDYVILHELCHIAEHNHSDKFWRLLSQVMPHWLQVKTKLDDMAELYLNE